MLNHIKKSNKIMSIAKLFILSLILSSCGLNKMVNQYNNVGYNVDPTTLEVKWQIWLTEIDKDKEITINNPNFKWR